MAKSLSKNLLLGRTASATMPSARADTDTAAPSPLSMWSGKVAAMPSTEHRQHGHLFAVILLAGMVHTIMTSRFVGAEYVRIISRIVEEWPF
jgi:hypothetical protein